MSRPFIAWMPVVFAGYAALLTGCEPSCKSTCASLLACDLESERVAIDECEAACVFQERLYEDVDANDLRSQFSAHKRCLVRESCDDIADGVCWDPDLGSL